MKHSASLRAVFFDIDDTLFSTTDFAESARRNAVLAMVRTGLDVDPEEALQELKEVIREFSSNHEHHFDKLLQRLPARTVRGINPIVLVASGVIAYHRTKVTQLRPFPDAVAVLRALSRTELIRGVITAGRAVKQAEKLLRLDLYRYICPTAIFISDQIGISKPNKKLFLRACKSLGVDPARTLYVGNDPVNDIDPANAAGMTTVLVRRGGGGAWTAGETSPHYRVRDFHQLLEILKRDFAVDART